MADINKVWISGVVINEPVFTKLPSKTPITTFSIRVEERFYDRNGILQTKANIISVESLGKNAETTVQKVKQGARYIVDGYLRQDQEKVCVRTFAVNTDESDDAGKHRSGLKQALEIIRNSRNLESAEQKIEELLETEKSWILPNTTSHTSKA